MILWKLIKVSKSITFIEGEPIPILYEKILYLIIKDGKALKVNMPTYLVEIKVHIPANIIKYLTYL